MSAREFVGSYKLQSFELRFDDGTIELGFRGDDEATARLLASTVAAGLPVISFARAASDLEELFLQVTAADEPVAAA